MRLTIRQPPFFAIRTFALLRTPRSRIKLRTLIPGLLAVLHLQLSRRLSPVQVPRHARRGTTQAAVIATKRTARSIANITVAVFARRTTLCYIVQNAALQFRRSDSQLHKNPIHSLLRPGTDKDMTLSISPQWCDIYLPRVILNQMPLALRF